MPHQKTLIEEILKYDMAIVAGQLVIVSGYDPSRDMAYFYFLTDDLKGKARKITGEILRPCLIKNL